MMLYVKKVRRDYHKAIIYLAEGGDLEDEEDAAVGEALEEDILAHKAFKRQSSVDEGSVATTTSKSKFGEFLDKLKGNKT